MTGKEQPKDLVVRFSEEANHEPFTVSPWETTSSGDLADASLSDILREAKAQVHRGDDEEKHRQIGVRLARLGFGRSSASLLTSTRSRTRSSAGSRSTKAWRFLTPTLRSSR